MHGTSVIKLRGMAGLFVLREKESGASWTTQQSSEVGGNGPANRAFEHRSADKWVSCRHRFGIHLTIQAVRTLLLGKRESGVDR